MEFAIKYLLYAQSANNPGVDAAASALLSDPAFLARIRSITETMAVSFLSNLARLRRGVDGAGRLPPSLLKLLIERVPSQYVWNPDIVDLFERARLMFWFQRLIVRRLRAARDIKEVTHLLHDRWLRKETIEKILARVNVAPFLPGADIDDEALASWATDMVHLHGRAPFLAQRILAQVPTEVIARLGVTYKYFGITEHDDLWWITNRLSFKALLFEMWHSRDAEAASACILKSVNRDFWLWANGGLRRPVDFTESKKGELTPGDVWLDVLARIDPDWVNIYLGELLRHAKPTPDAKLVPDICTAIEYAAGWLVERGREAGERLWKTLEDRLQRAAGHDDATDEELCAIVRVSLPGPPARRRKLREDAVRVLRLRHSPGMVPLGRWYIRQFVELLRQEEPDLYAELHKNGEPD